MQIVENVAACLPVHAFVSIFFKINFLLLTQSCFAHCWFSVCCFFLAVFFIRSSLVTSLFSHFCFWLSQFTATCGTWMCNTNCNLINFVAVKCQIWQYNNNNNKELLSHCHVSCCLERRGNEKIHTHIIKLSYVTANCVDDT